jgi:hypothetical protein
MQWASVTMAHALAAPRCRDHLAAGVDHQFGLIELNVVTAILYADPLSAPDCWVSSICICCQVCSNSRLASANWPGNWHLLWLSTISGMSLSVVIWAARTTAYCRSQPAEPQDAEHYRAKAV